MNLRWFALLAVLAAGSLVPPPAAAQATGENWEPPRLNDGRPDLQGVWDFRTATPLERPEAIGERTTLTDEEAAAVEFGATQFQQAADAPPPDGSVGAYNNNMQLFQGADHVVILNEMVHDARIVPLDGRPHAPDAIRQWTGDSRGRWDGDTLVIETRNFSDRTASFDPSALTALGTGATLRLTERFTRVGDDTLLYEYTVDDAATFTRPFTVALPMRRSALPIYEYACHEGNYGMVNALSGARAAEAGR